MIRCNKVHQLRLEALQRQQSTAAYPYQFRNKNAGILLGHRLCNISLGLVPKDMGWLWNLNTEKGWCPGAVRSPVGKIMKQFLYPKKCPDNEPVVELEKPMLRINKKDGDYQITLDDQENDPIVFQIKKDLKLKEAKDILKSKGILKSCNCNNLSTCRCLNSTEKLEVVTELHEVSKNLQLGKKLSYSELRESSESEVNFEFTPESAANKSQKKKLESLAGTQYDQNDYEQIDVPAKHKRTVTLKTDEQRKKKTQRDYSKGSENSYGHESDNYHDDDDDNDNFYGLEFDEDERKLRSNKTIKNTPKTDKSIKTVSRGGKKTGKTTKKNTRYVF